MWRSGIMQKLMKIIYEIIMVVLVMATIITLWTENSYDSTINFVVWIVFSLDFFIRLFKTKEKWRFIKENPFLLIAIIPLDQFFQIARIVRLIYLFRIKTITKYYVSPYIMKLTYQSKTLIASFFILLLLGESAVIWRLESSIITYYDALFATFGHLLFFGRHIFVIENSISFWLLTGTSILGIVAQGLALQWALAKIDPYIVGLKEKFGMQNKDREEERTVW